MNKFISFYSMMREKPNTKYPFLISGIHPKTEIFLFYSFGVKGLKNCIVQDSKNTIDKILFGIEKMMKKDYKLILVKFDFLLKSYKNTQKKKLAKLSTTAVDFFFNLLKALANYTISKKKFLCGCWKNPFKNLTLTLVDHLNFFF